MYLLRVSLPDRPGSLGSVASAMGTVNADISAVEIVEKYEGYAVDDFIVDLPPDTPADGLVAACTSIPGVELIWISHYSEDWGLQGDVDVLNRMTEQPQFAQRILTQAAPDVFRSNWAVLVDREARQPLFQTELAPDLTAQAIAAFGPLDVASSRELKEGWLEGWGETLIAAAPFKGPETLVIGRHGGPEFLASEVARLRHLAALAG
ncbi:MAG: amino acid-binding protein [Propionibacteriaceae bacterium]|jgi:hypothetical protein|nr:amino acid-binding protein [Propionibacteriaceae bacterium]